MKLVDLIQARDRHTWTVRLVAYIAVVVTVCIIFQFLNVFFFA